MKRKNNNKRRQQPEKKGTNLTRKKHTHEERNCEMNAQARRNLLKGLHGNSSNNNNKKETTH
jgi:hypothetical protein